jgi:transposase
LVAKVLADLLAAGLIPAVWIGDERVRMLRRLVSRRRGLVKRRTQIKNEIAGGAASPPEGPQPGQRSVRQERPANGERGSRHTAQSGRFGWVGVSAG